LQISSRTSTTGPGCSRKWRRAVLAAEVADIAIRAAAGGRGDVKHSGSAVCGHGMGLSRKSRTDRSPAWWSLRKAAAIAIGQRPACARSLIRGGETYVLGTICYLCLRSYP
jgi:hypothetical protein